MKTSGFVDAVSRISNVHELIITNTLYNELFYENYEEFRPKLNSIAEARLEKYLELCSDSVINKENRDLKSLKNEDIRNLFDYDLGQVGNYVGIITYNLNTQVSTGNRLSKFVNENNPRALFQAFTRLYYVSSFYSDLASVGLEIKNYNFKYFDLNYATLMRNLGFKRVDPFSS